ncbi:hypothetical protein LTR94_032740, partial [Friedmanniomyces endolithicus]
MTALAGSAAAAEALILGIAATPAAAAIVPADDARLQIDAHATLPDGQGTLKGYVAAPRGARPRGTVIVLHENRGLNAHIEDVARRVALAGFVAIAPDLLTDQGGTPADEDRARALIAAADLERVVAETVGLARHYAAAAPRARVG